MKLFKLIKSIDYVSYPSYKELVKISDAVSNSLATFRDMLISAIVGVIFDNTPISEYILANIAEKFPDSTAEKIASYQNTPIILSIMITIAVFGVIKLACFIAERWGSNKNTKKKRDMLVYEFYNVAIPQLIEVKSMLEQMRDDQSGEKRKKILLLLQAKQEICALYQLLFEMNIVERDETGLQTEDSSILSNRISKYAYQTFLEEMLDILDEIYTGLSGECQSHALSDIDDIRSIINSSGVFDKVNGLEAKLRESRARINPQRTI